MSHPNVGSHRVGRRPTTSRRRRRLLRVASVLASCAALLSVSGCGGNSASVGGIGGSGYVFGPIEELGSITVAGVTFETDGATVTIDGELFSPDQLEVGMVAAVSGVISDDGASGQATVVEVERAVVGEIESDGGSGGQFDVLGQTVDFTNSTVLRGLAPGDLVRGASVVVDGFVDDDGRVRATRIAAGPATSDVRLRGPVSMLDADALTLRVRAVRVRFANATVLGTLANDEVVAVRGTVDAGRRVLDATLVRVVDTTPRGAADDIASFEGVVVRVVNDSIFRMAGIDRRRTVLTGEETVFVGGAFADLGPRSRVRVFARVRGDAVLVAERVTFLE